MTLAPKWLFSPPSSIGSTGRHWPPASTPASTRHPLPPVPTAFRGEDDVAFLRRVTTTYLADFGTSTGDPVPPQFEYYATLTRPSGFLRLPAGSGRGVRTHTPNTTRPVRMSARRPAALAKRPATLPGRVTPGVSC